jgi:hypothetical protein
MAGPPKAAASLSARLSEAKKVAGVLNQITDDLNKKLFAVQHGLGELKLGVSASIELPADFGEDAPSLAYMKSNNGWGLYIETHNSITPLANASRALRLQAADKLQELVEELLRVTDEQVAEVRARVAKVDAIVSALGVDLTKVPDETPPFDDFALAPSTDDDIPF